ANLPTATSSDTAAPSRRGRRGTGRRACGRTYPAPRHRAVMTRTRCNRPADGPSWSAGRKEAQGMEPDITPDDVISLSEKLAALDLSPGEAAVLAAALGTGADDADRVAGFAFVAPKPADFAPALLRSIGPSIDASHEKWIELISHS